jgi:GNAT superfamily N-acetyltransferase
LTLEGIIVGYCAILFNDEPEYDKIVGQWLTNGDFIVFHRVAIAEGYLRKGLAQVLLGFIEALARKQNIPSLKADTNFDNAAMLALFAKLGYTYCGEVYFRGSPRKAFEKVLI